MDSNDNAYVTGETNSNQFPITSGAYQTICSPDPNSTRRVPRRGKLQRNRTFPHLSPSLIPPAPDLSTQHFWAAMGMRTQIPLPSIPPAAPTWPATRRSLAPQPISSKAAFPPPAVRSSAETKLWEATPIRLCRGVRSHRRQTAVFHYLRRPEFRVRDCLPRRYVWYCDHGGWKRLLLSGRRDPGQRSADHRRGHSAHQRSPGERWNLCGGVARLHCQIQSRYFLWWSIASICHLPGRAH